VPLQVLHSALKSALNATAANIRLTKRGSFPVLCLTITTNSINNMPSNPADDPPGTGRGPQDDNDTSIDFTNNSRERETEITQDIPVRVMSPEQVEGIHEPRCREADVFIQLPPLAQLKSATDKLTRLAAAPPASSSGPGPAAASAPGPRLDMAANARGCLRVGAATDAMRMASTWTGLANPGLDPAASGGGGRGGGAAAAAAGEGDPGARGALLGDAEGRGEEGWARVRIDARGWGKVMSVGRLAASRVIAGAYGWRAGELVRLVLRLTFWFQDFAMTMLSSCTFS
jgi:HUS1 checkpoint protein